MLVRTQTHFQLHCHSAAAVAEESLPIVEALIAGSAGCCCAASLEFHATRNSQFLAATVAFARLAVVAEFVPGAFALKIER